MYFFIEQGEYQFSHIWCSFLLFVDCDLFTRQETEVLQSEADLSLIQANVERENRQQVIFTTSQKVVMNFICFHSDCQKFGKVWHDRQLWCSSGCPGAVEIYLIEKWLIVLFIHCQSKSYVFAFYHITLKLYMMTWQSIWSKLAS